ncbi:DUF4221 family protein [Algoriphagus aestuarii]|nr:DUF4221 family protein [Algoriphagus aestuarii]
MGYLISRSSFKIILILFGIGFSSCNNNKPFVNLNLDDFKIDTLIFKSENEIIELGDDGEFLAFSAISKNTPTYSIFNLEKRFLYTLDLKTRKLLSKLEMPNEGPDGIGDWIIDFQMINDSSFMAQGDKVFYFFNKEGKRTNRVRVDHHFYLNPDLNRKFPNTGFLYKDKHFHFTTVKMGTNESEVLSYDSEIDTIYFREIPFVDLIKNSSVITLVESFTFYSSPAFVISDFPGGFLIVNRGMPNMTAYLANGDTVSTKPNSSKFFEDLEPVEEVFRAKNEIEEKEFKRELEKRMNFLLPIVDEKNQKLFRLGYHLTSDGVSYNNYLFEYDADLNLTREIFLDGIKLKPRKMFLKESTFYLAASFDDEPGLLIFENPFKK